MGQAPPQPKTYTDDLGHEFTLDFRDVQIGTIKGASIGIPEGMSVSEAIWWLKLKQRDEETEVAINERIEGYPIDVAYSLQLAVMKIFGIRELRSTPGFFGEKPPTFMSVPINARGDMVEVFIGRFSCPGLEGGFLESSRDWNDALIVKGKVKQKCLPVVRTLVGVTKEMLRQHSLYKGKAFRVGMTEETEGFATQLTMENPEFIDVRKAPAILMLNQDTTELLQAALRTPIERTEQTRSYGVSVKRGILLQGPYGTGKSLTALETAKLCEENGWTFVYLKDVKDLRRVYRFAARYAPAVMFAEDIDLVIKAAENAQDDGLNMLNNVLDGVDSKAAEVILVLTTNYVHKLPQSLLRPGRFDAMIEYLLPDSDTAARLVKQYGGSDIDIENFDMKVVGDALKGNQPATIHEVIKRAKLFAQQRYDKTYRGPLKLATRDIVLSNKSMQGHLELLNRKTVENPTGMQQLGITVGRYIAQGVWAAVHGKDSPLSPGRLAAIERDVAEQSGAVLVGHDVASNEHR